MSRKWHKASLCIFMDKALSYYQTRQGGNAMSDYKISVDIEPTEAYKKAKSDMLKALESIRLLDPAQQQKLAEELLGAAGFACFCQLLDRYYRR